MSVPLPQLLRPPLPPQRRLKVLRACAFLPAKALPLKVYSNPNVGRLRLVGLGGSSLSVRCRLSPVRAAESESPYPIGDQEPEKAKNDSLEQWDSLTAS
uniref:Uncharacterized protein n=1 Tax=Kalanchoe fedtschenkoi TaxID=63787 RepID=A0A7N0UKJ2_KALFE